MSFWGGGLLVVLAIALWAAVLIPAAVKNRHARREQKQQTRLTHTMQRLETVANDTGSYELVTKARDALAREKLLQLENERRYAQQLEELARAKAARKLAKMRAKSVHRQQKARVRSAKLAGAAVRRLRLLLAAGFVTGVVAVFVGLGFVLAGNGTALLLTAAGVTGVCLGGLLLLAPGRAGAAQQVAAPAVPVATTRQEISLSGLEIAQQLRAEQQRAAQVLQQQKLAAHLAAKEQAARRSAAALARSRARITNRPQQLLPAHNQQASMLLTPEKPAAVSPFAQMGHIDSGSLTTVDVDAALKRRRA